MIILIRMKKGVSTLMLINKTVRVPDKVNLNCPKINVTTECLNTHDQCGPTYYQIVDVLACVNRYVVVEIFQHIVL